MKTRFDKLSLMIILILSFQTGSAQPSPASYQDSLMQQLDKSRIPNGALYNRVFGWADLISLKPGKEIDYQYVRQAWYELYLSKYNNGNLKSIDYLDQRIHNNRSDTPFITLGYIDYAINYVDSSAFTNGALLYDTTLNRWQDGNLQLNPYQKKEVILPVIATERIIGGVTYFYFDPNAILLNGTNKTIKHLQLSIGNFQVTLKPGDKVRVDLGILPAGRRSLDVRVVFEGAIPAHLYPYLLDWGSLAPLSLTTNVCRDDNPTDIWSGPDLKFKGYDESVATQGKGQYMTFYKLNDISGSGCLKKITKPIIFLDGFDPEDLRKIQVVNTVNGVDYEPIWNFLSYGDDKHLGDELRLMGYDIIVLNFPKYNDAIHTGGVDRDGGADYIERNAMVLTRLIQYVNEQLNINVADPVKREIVIAGPSMGGQISRYALAYMEKMQSLNPTIAKWNHRCRLWISFDSPHRGANIPIGLQQFMYFFGNTYNDLFAKEQYDKKIRSKAGRQMLIHQMDGLNRSSSYFNTYYNNLQANGLTGSEGYPQNLRKISLADGMGNGTNIGTPGENSLHFTASSNLAGISLDAAKVIIKNTQANSTPVKTLDAYALKHINPLLHFGFGYYNETSSSSIPVSNMSLQTKVINMGLSVAGWLPWHVKVNLYEADYFSANTTGHGSLDVVQGGQHDGIDFLKKTLDKKLRATPGIDETSITAHVNQKTATFMPTVSTLGFKNINFNWGNAIDDRDLVCTGEIPFDNYFFAKHNNMAHVELNEESANWVKEEIKHGRQGCPNICATKINMVGGDRYMCPGTTYTFTLDEVVPIGAITQWEPSPGLIPLSSNNNQITVKYTSGGAVPTTKFIKATIIPQIGGAPCAASKVITKEVSYGDNFTLTVNTFDPLTPYFTVRVNNTSSANTFQWKLDASYPWPAENPLEIRNLTKIGWLDPMKYYSVRVLAPGCGILREFVNMEYPRRAHDFTISEFSEKSGESKAKSISLSPNPSSDKWDLALPKEWQDRIVNIKVISTDGRVMSAFSQSVNNTISIDASEWAAGIYIIHIKSDAMTETLKAVKR